MNSKVKDAIEKYQCSGCISGCDISCFKTCDTGNGCGAHYAGTYISNIGKILLGMPKGFNRLGEIADLKPYIFENFKDSDYGEYDKWNIPVWKYLSKDGHTFVRGMTPRLNKPFIHIYLEDCMSEINCLEITQEDIDYMD